MNKKIIVIGIVSIFLLTSITTLPVIGMKTISQNNKIMENIFSTNTYEPDEKIIIHGNDAFTEENGVTNGSGIENDPYVIEGWDLSYIEIKDTTKYFTITGCRIISILEDEEVINGVFFNNVKNGKIQNCEIKGRLGHDYSYSGIALFNSNNNVIEHCKIYHCPGFAGGIWLVDSNDNVIHHCDTWDCDICGGIAISNSENNEIHHCNVWDCFDGISVFCTEGFNEIHHCNVCDCCNGFTMDWSSGINIHHCNVSDNNVLGFNINNCSDNIIHHNNIQNLFNAKESDTGKDQKNYWDDDTDENGIGEGNYWGDYTLKHPLARKLNGIWNTPYDIYGDSNAKDRYPLINPVSGKSKSKSVNTLENFLERFPLLARLFSLPIFTNLLNLK